MRGREAKLVLWGAVLVGVAVRLLVFRGRGFPSDVDTFMAWGEHVARGGPSSFYATISFADYPPGFLYVLWLVGALFDGEALRLVVKALSIPADIALAYVLYRVVASSAGPMAGALTGALWMLQPGPIFAGPFWGQVDSWGTLPFLGALVMAGQRRWVAAGVLAALAGMVKPQFGLAAVVITAAALIEWAQDGGWRPAAKVVASGLAAAVAVALPFRLTPGAFVDLVRSASETYPYTSLYAFNAWSVVGDFWKPDDRYVVVGAVALVAGILASLAALWWRRDVAALLAVGAFVAMAFYFLPTRAHERYLFPAFALLAPFAVTRSRILLPYVVMAVTFFATLYFAFTRYPQNGLAAPGLVESTLFGRNGQILMAVVLMGSAALIVWRLVRGEMELRDTVEVGLAPRERAADEPAPARRWALPAGLGPGGWPTKRDVSLALLVALAVLATRGYRLDQPRDMYFDEVYHARTAMELLAQREPYEWTHPHLAKEIMALGILAFGGDRVEGREAIAPGASALAVANDGTRAIGYDGRIETLVRGSDAVRVAQVDGRVRALAFSGADLYAATERRLYFVAEGYRGVAQETALPAPPLGLVASSGRAVVAMADETRIYAPAAAPVVAKVPAVALTARPDTNDVYVADGRGTIRVIDAATGRTTGRITAVAPISSLAWAQGPGRLYAGRAGEAAVDWYEPPRDQQSTGTHGGTAALANARTGELAGGVRSLALVPRSQMLYALVGQEAVVIETHGASAFASIAVRGSLMGVDGLGDELEVAGDGVIERIPTGRHAFAWRLPGVVLGALMAFFIVLIARRLFASAVVAVLAGAIVVLDGAMFAQARIGMNDIYIATFLVAGWYFVIAAHRPKRSAAVDLLLAGILFGLGAASKWAAFYALAGLGLYSVAVTAYAWSRARPGSGGPFDLLAWRGRVPNAAYLFLCFAVLPALIYVASYARWFGGPTVPYGWDLVELTKQMYWYHSGLTAPHPAGSPWWSWPLVLKPVYWYLGSPGQGSTAVIYDTGNVVLFWGGIVALGWAAVTAARARSWSLGILVFAMLTQYVAWIPITRVLFFYHFFTALPFYLLILAAGLGALWERGRAGLVTGYMTLAAAAFLFFYPFVSGLPTPADQASAFFILPTWQYDCQFYPDFRCEPRLPGDVAFQPVVGRLAVAAGLGLVGYVALSALRKGGAERIRALVRASLSGRARPAR